MLCSTDPERLGNKKGLNRDGRKSLRRRNTINFLGGLGAGGVVNNRLQLGRD